MTLALVEMHRLPPPKAPSFFVELFLFFFLVQQIAVLGHLCLLFVILIIVLFVVGDDVQMNRVDLRNFQLGFALRAAQNLAFFHFVFVDIDFGRTFRAANHGSSIKLLASIVAKLDGCRKAYYILRGMKSTV
jgi:hypothetical protein